MDLSRASDTINNSSSTTETVLAGVPQLSIDGPLFFNIFMKDLVLFTQYTILGKYTDDSNISNGRSDKDNLKKSMLSNFKTLRECFHDNFVIINTDKCYTMCFGKNKNDNGTFSFNEFNLKNSNEESILVIKIDRKLTLSNHIKTLCRKAGQTLCIVSCLSSLRACILKCSACLSVSCAEHADVLTCPHVNYFCKKLRLKCLRRFWISVNPLSVNYTKWSNTLKQFVANLPTNCLSVFDHFVGLLLKGY